MLILDTLEVWFHHDDSVEPLQIVDSDDCTSDPHLPSLFLQSMYRCNRSEFASSLYRHVSFFLRKLALKVPILKAYCSQNTNLIPNLKSWVKRCWPAQPCRDENNTIIFQLSMEFVVKVGHLASWSLFANLAQVFFFFFLLPITGESWHFRYSIVRDGILHENQGVCECDQ